MNMFTADFFFFDRWTYCIFHSITKTVCVALLFFLTEYSWCSMSSMALLHFSSCTGSFCWPRAFIQPAQSKNCTASSRPPSVDAASVEWYVKRTWLLNTEHLKCYSCHVVKILKHIRKEDFYYRNGCCAVFVSSVCVPHIHSGGGLARCVWLLGCAGLPLLQHVVHLCHHEV